MKKSLVVGLLLPVLTLASCHIEREDTVASRTHRAIACFDNAETRVSLSQSDQSLDLISRWIEGEKIHSFIYDGKSFYQLNESHVRDVTPDGKGCVFYYELPEGFQIPSDGYWLICFSEAGHPSLINRSDLPSSVGSISSGEEVLVYDATLFRERIDAYSAPVSFAGIVKGADDVIVFRHYLTYEVLHVNNTTDAPITFSLLGFNTDGPKWFHERVTVCYDNRQVFFKQDLTPMPQASSPAISVPSNNSATIISAYLPGDNKIADAVMVAEINGITVYSSNSLSSNSVLRTGRAYHMYVTWDGSSLRFTTASGAVGSEVDAGGEGYGQDGSGNISGQGLGYGTDSSGNITGGGSGYGTDGSGSLSGGGSGYSNGN